MTTERELTSIRIKEAMEEKRLSYRELSELTGIAKSSLQRYVTNVKSKIPMDNAIKIANKLNVQLAWLIGIDAEKKQLSKGILDSDIQMKEYFEEKGKEDLFETFKTVTTNDSLRVLMDSAAELTSEDLEPVLILIQDIRKSKGIE